MRRSEYLKASPPMFESGLLDRFTRVHPAVPVLIYLPVIAVLLRHRGRAASALLTALGLALGGYAVWTLTEYWLHRVVFHFEPERGIGARLHWMIHGVHHDHPNDPMRLVMPPSASVPLALAFDGAVLARAGRRRRDARSPPASSRATSPTTWSTTPCTTTCRARRSAAGCASCTCATTSRTTSAASASARRTGTACSGPHRARARGVVQASGRSVMLSRS